MCMQKLPMSSELLFIPLSSVLGAHAVDSLNEAAFGGLCKHGSSAAYRAFFLLRPFTVPACIVCVFFTPARCYFLAAFFFCFISPLFSTFDASAPSLFTVGPSRGMVTVSYNRFNYKNS